MPFVKLNLRSLKFKISDDKVNIRFGVWDYVELSFEKKIFEENDADFKYFLNFFRLLLKGDTVDEKYFLKNKFYESILDELINYKIISKESSKDSLKQEENKLLITDYNESPQYVQYFFSKYKKVLDIKTFFNEIKKFNYDYSSEKLVKSLLAKINLKKFNYVTVIMLNPNINMLKVLNRMFLHDGINWELGFLDNQFIHFMAFSPFKTACFECLEQQNSLRIADYENYLDFMSEEKKFQSNLNSSLDIFPYIANTFLMIDSSNHPRIINPLEGRIMTIYIPNLEINVEDLHRSPICPADGYQSIKVSEEYNNSAIESVKELFSIEKNKDYKK